MTRVNTGQVLSFESCAIGVPTVSLFTEGHTGSCIIWQVTVRPHGVRDPEHVFVYFIYGTWEIPVVSVGVGNPTER